MWHLQFYCVILSCNFIVRQTCSTQLCMSHAVTFSHEQEPAIKLRDKIAGVTSVLVLSPVDCLTLMWIGCVLCRGVVIVDVLLSWLDINQCPQDYFVPNAFKDTARCHYDTTYVCTINVYYLVPLLFSAFQWWPAADTSDCLAIRVGFMINLNCVRSTVRLKSAKQPDGAYSEWIV